MHGAARALGPPARARNGRDRPLVVPAHRRTPRPLSPEKFATPRWKSTGCPWPVVCPHRAHERRDRTAARRRVPSPLASVCQRRGDARPMFLPGRCKAASPGPPAEPLQKPDNRRTAASPGAGSPAVGLASLFDRGRHDDAPSPTPAPALTGGPRGVRHPGAGVGAKGGARNARELPRRRRQKMPRRARLCPCHFSSKVILNNYHRYVY